VTDEDVEPVTMRRVSFRLLPFLFLLYIFCWLDRGNISIAALQMNSELKFSSAVFGFGAGIFFLSYALFELPSNLILARVGARRWLARIAITWGLLACSMMWVRTPLEFYALRFLLGNGGVGFLSGSHLLSESVVSGDLPGACDLRHHHWYPAVASTGCAARRCSKGPRRPPGLRWSARLAQLAVSLDPPSSDF
jgi:hypothetical protein